MNEEKKEELLEKEKAELAKTKTRVRSKTRETTDAIIYGVDKNGKPRNATPSWKEMSKKQKTDTVLGLLFILVSVLYVVLAANAANWFPGTYFATIFSSEEIDPSASWWVRQSRPILQTIFYFLLLIGISRIIRTLLTLITRKGSKKTITLVKLVNSAVNYAAWIVLAFVVLSVWGVDTNTILASAGIVALVIGLGAQSLIADLIGGLGIVMEQEFEVGDTVVIDEFRGVVVEIGLAATKITDAAGNTKTIRNSQISSAINLSQENSVAVVDIPVDYASDLKRVRKVIEDSLPAIGKKTKGVIGTPKFLGVQEFQDSGILLRITASVREEDKFGVTRALNEAVYNLFIENAIDIPFNQIVVSKRGDGK